MEFLKRKAAKSNCIAIVTNPDETVLSEVVQGIMVSGKNAVAVFCGDGKPDHESDTFDMVFIEGSALTPERLKFWANRCTGLLCGDNFKLEGDRRVAETVAGVFPEKPIMCVSGTDIWTHGLKVRPSDKPRVFIGVPIYKEAHPEFLKSVDAFGAKYEGVYQIIIKEVRGDAMVSRARANLLGAYLQTGPHDFFVGIDCDISFEPDMLHGLLQQMILTAKEGKAIHSYGALYPYKMDPPAAKAGCPVLRPLDGVLPDKETGLWEIEWQGGGFYIVTDDLLKRLMAAHPELHHFNHSPDPKVVDEEANILSHGEETWALWADMLVENPRWGCGKCELISEDWAFMERIRRIGEKNYVNMYACTKHWVGDKAYEIACETLTIPPDMEVDTMSIQTGCYDVPLEIEKPRILDIGACVGAFSAWAAERWPGAAITAYEPNPEALAILEKNAELVPNLVVSPVGVREFAAHYPLRPGLGNLGCSSFKDIGEQGKPGPDVMCVAARDLPEADIIKIDTEGCELEILQGMEKAGKLDRPKAILLEAHSRSDQKEILFLLMSKGFYLYRSLPLSGSDRISVMAFVRV